MENKDIKPQNSEKDKKPAVKEKNEGGQRKAPKNRVINAVGYLKSKYDFRFNNIGLVYEMRKKGKSEFIKMNEDYLFLELQNNYIPVSAETIIRILKSGTICEEFDPIRQYFENLSKWDEKKDPDFISELASHIKTTDDKAFSHHFKKHLIRSVRCAIDDNYVNKQALIIVGSRQNTGKTSFIRYLCPPELVKYRAENVSVDKDSRILLCKNFQINLDELDHLDKKDLSSLKSLFSKDWINDRLPYDKTNSQIPRRCSFFGSTNLAEFLTDETGSVRWVCFSLVDIDSPINFSYTKINISDVWRQAHTLYKQGFPADLSPDEIRENELRNKAFKLASMEYECIYKLFRQDEKQNPENFKTPTEIMKLILDTMQGAKLNIHRVGVGKALISLGYKRLKHDGIYGYFVKMKNSLTQVTQSSEMLAEQCPY